MTSPTEDDFAKNWKKIQLNCVLPCCMPTEIGLHDSDLGAIITQQGQANVRKLMELMDEILPCRDE